MKAGAIDKGVYVLFRGDPFLVTDREFVNPGKGSAFVRLKLKHARTGQVIREVIKSHETVVEADVEARDAQYLYSDADHLVFMDVSMPGMDGFEATSAIRDFERRTNRTPTPIIALSANTVEALREDARTSEMDGFLSKPVSKSALLDKIAWCRDVANEPALSDFRLSAGGTQIAAGGARH